MGKKRRKKKNKATKEIVDFGRCELYCKACDYKFEIDWETIFEIQEMTHGYVGYHLNDVFINCPKCDEIISEDSNDDPLLETNNEKQSKISIDDDDLPF